MEELAAPAADWRDPAPVLRPRSLAILGASPGSRWLPVFQEQIPGAGYQGGFWLVNPRHPTIGGQTCYPSVRDTPEVPEHVLVQLPAAAVVDALEEAAAAGVRGATVYATGWAESGPEGEARERALRELARRTGLRICGPNCLGSISVREAAIGYPLRVREWLRPGGLAAVFQSGALLYPFLRACGERGAGFSYLVSCGNEVDLDLADYVRFLVEDRDTKAIVLLVEGIRAPAKFRAALDMALAAGKPIALMKVGRTQRSQLSTATHTGAIAGSDEVFRALCRRVGVAQCDSLDQLVETARLLAAPARPAGRRAAVLVFSGALRSFALDRAIGCGIELTLPSGQTAARVAATAPLDLRIVNPLDCGFHAGTQTTYMALGQALLEDPAVDLLLIQEHAPDPARNRDPAQLRRLAEASAKPVVVMTEAAFSRTQYTEQFIAQAGVPFLQGIDLALVAVGQWAACAQAARERANEQANEGCAGRTPPAALAPGLHGLGDIAGLLERYGVRASATRRARTDQEAVAAAGQIGYPVALKIESPDIAHKSDVGGVRLALRDADAVRAAWQDMHADLARQAPAARLEGALVARMAAPGLEMSVGVTRDEQFGPVLMVGLGGAWIEVLRDASLRLLPLAQGEARAMLDELACAALLGPFRGAAARDVLALERAMQGIARLARDFGDRLVALEVNPLLVYAEGEGALAVDARLVLA